MYQSDNSPKTDARLRIDCGQAGLKRAYPVKTDTHYV